MGAQTADRFEPDVWLSGGAQCCRLYSGGAGCVSHDDHAINFNPFTRDALDCPVNQGGRWFSSRDRAGDRVDVERCYPIRWGNLQNPGCLVDGLPPHFRVYRARQRRWGLGNTNTAHPHSGCVLGHLWRSVFVQFTLQSCFWHENSILAVFNR